MNDYKQWLRLTANPRPFLFQPFGYFRTGPASTRPRPLWLLLTVPLLLGLAACQRDEPAATAAAGPAHNSGDSRVATRISDKRRLTDFALVDHHGRPFNRERLLGQWSLVFFGFTRCPDICPPTLTQLGAIVQLLPPQDKPPLRIVFISVDPAADTPQVMARYVSAYNDVLSDEDEWPSHGGVVEYITGVTGDERQIKGLAAQLGVHYRINEAHQHHRRGAQAADNATDGAPAPTGVDHSGTVLLLDPDAYLHAVFAPPLPSIGPMMQDIFSLTGKPRPATTGPP